MSLLRRPPSPASSLPRWPSRSRSSSSALRDGPSLIDTVGTEFIDRFAAPLKDLAVSLFGTNDKTALVTGIVIVCLVAGGLLGRAAARRRWVGPVGFAGFALIGIATGTTDPLASGPLMVAAAVLGCVAGLATLELLLRRARPVTSPRRLADVSKIRGSRKPRADPSSHGAGAPRQWRS